MTAEKTPGQVTDAKAALDFMLGGNATFTLKSKASGERYTFKVQQAKFNPTQFFVSYLVGSDNENDYAYIGMVVPWEQGNVQFKLTKKSKLLLDSKPIQAIKWTVHLLQNPKGEMPAQLEFWHSGKCGKCGRTLTVPESLQTGFGPECRKQLYGVSKLRETNIT